MKEELKGRKAIGYIRFSSDDQAEGNSVERQTANITAYCERNNLELTETLVDDGLSAYKGEHLQRGKLGIFLAAVEKGRYRDHALIVEALDRVSRAGISESTALVARLLKGGVELHLTQNNQITRNLDDLPTAMLNVVESYMAREYSKKISERVGSAWKAKKRNGKAGVAITAMMPSWLEGRSGEPIRVNERVADVVREIFKLTAQGMGKRMICRQFNERGVSTFGGGKRWVHSGISHILHNRAVLGEYQPMKGSEPDGDPRLGFFPAIVTPGFWERAHSAMASRRVTTDNGTVTGKYAGRTGEVRNLFTGLVFDISGAAAKRMSFRDRGKGSRPKLTTEKTSSERPNAFDYALFEGWFLTFLDQIDWTTILGESDSEVLRQADETVARFGLDIERGEQRKQRIINLLIDTPSQGLKDELLNTEAKIEKAKADKATAEQRLNELKRKHSDLLDKSVVYGKLAESRDLGTRARLREEIRRKVSQINFAFHQPGMERNDTTLVAVKFVNGVTMVLVFIAGGVVMAGPYGNPNKWVTLKGGKVIRYTPEDRAAIKRAVIRELSKKPRK
jgi:DNA invertase Pin-like site-specific DNA recombinase